MGRGSGVRAASATSVEISFYYKGTRCRERIRVTPDAAGRKFVKRLKASIEHDIAINTFEYSKYFPDSPRAQQFAPKRGGGVLLRVALYEWLDSKRAKLTPETFSEYEKDIAKHLVPVFGEKRLSELMRGDVSKWAEASGLSVKRLSNILIPLRSTYTRAMNQIPPAVTHNPLANFRLEAPRSLEDEEAEAIEPFSGDELAAILTQCPPGLANMVQFWAWCGLRPQEIFPLRWDDIDFRAGVVCVRRALREGRLKVTKTKSSRRDVKLLQPALDALKRQKELTLLAGAEVFLNPRTGEPWAGDGAFRKTAWLYALQRAKVRYRGPKQLRHTYASVMLSAGENPMWVAQQMGHKDWSMIVKVYGRFIPSVDPLAGSRAVAALTADGQHLDSIAKNSK